MTKHNGSCTVTPMLCGTERSNSVPIERPVHITTTNAAIMEPSTRIQEPKANMIIRRKQKLGCCLGSKLFSTSDFTASSSNAQRVYDIGVHWCELTDNATLFHDVNLTVPSFFCFPSQPGGGRSTTCSSDAGTSAAAVPSLVI